MRSEKVFDPTNSEITIDEAFAFLKELAQLPQFSEQKRSDSVDLGCANDRDIILVHTRNGLHIATLHAAGAMKDEVLPVIAVDFTPPDYRTGYIPQLPAMTRKDLVSVYLGQRTEAIQMDPTLASLPRLPLCLFDQHIPGLN